MHHGKLVFAQLMEHLPLHTFRRCVARYPGRYPTLKFSRSTLADANEKRDWRYGNRRWADFLKRVGMRCYRVLVEWRRIELPTFALRTRRSPS